MSSPNLLIIYLQDSVNFWGHTLKV